MDSEWPDAGIFAKGTVNRAYPVLLLVLCLLRPAKPESLNQCLKKWAELLLLEDRKATSIASDGKSG